MTIIILCAVLIATSTIAAVFITASVILKRIKALSDQMNVIGDIQINSNHLNQYWLLKNFFSTLECQAHIYSLEIDLCEKKEEYERCAELLECQQQIRASQDLIELQLNKVK